MITVPTHDSVIADITVQIESKLQVCKDKMIIDGKNYAYCLFNLSAPELSDLEFANLILSVDNASYVSSSYQIDINAGYHQQTKELVLNTVLNISVL